MTLTSPHQWFEICSFYAVPICCALTLLSNGCSRDASTSTSPKESVSAANSQITTARLLALIDQSDYDTLFSQRDEIIRLTANNDPQTAATAFAALMTVDGHFDPAWELAWSSATGFMNLLAAMPLLADAHLRIALADRSLPLLDDASLNLLSGWPDEQRLAVRKAILASLALVPGKEDEIRAALETARNDPVLCDEADLALERIAATSPKAIVVASRSFQQETEMANLKPMLDWPDGSRSFARGRRVYHELGCHRCHILNEHDTLIGPNLRDPKYRPSRSELAEAIIEPDKQIADDYRQYMLVANGKPTTGLVTEQTADYLIVIADPMHDCTPQRVERDELDGDPEPLTTSAMPSGMVDVLSIEELLDLLAYVEAKCDPKDSSFRQMESP